MATLQELAANDTVHKIDADLRPGVQPERILYVTPGLADWLQTILPTLESTWHIELSPLEQVAMLVEDFCSGKPLVVGQRFRSLKPARKAVWELKTPDVRIFGWFVFRDCFLGVKADLADRIKLYDLYGGYMGEVERSREEIDLDDPKFIEGNDPDAVISNCDFA